MASHRLVIVAVVLAVGAGHAAPARKAAKPSQTPAPAVKSREPRPTPSPATASASTRLAPPAEAAPAQGPWVELALGPAFPFNRGPLWARGQLRVGLPVAKLDDRLELSAFLPLSVGRAGETGAFLAESSVLALDLVPSARLAFRGPGRWGFHGDFGVGVAHLRYSFRIPELGEAKASSTGLAFRAAAGVDYRVGRSLHLFLEPLHLLFHTAQEGVFRFGNTSFTSSTGAGAQASVLAGAGYAW
jgi:hypothetical protein